MQQIHHEFSELNIRNPRIAVAALNPHGSDNGLFGHEEADNLIPAVKAAQELGINAIGPVPADSVFHLGKQGRYDAILSCITIRGISPVRRSILNVRSPLPSVCRLCAAPWITVRPSISPVPARRAPSVCWSRRWWPRVTGK